MIARAYLPMVTHRYSQILNVEPRLLRDGHTDAVKYARDENPPEGCSSTSWFVLNQTGLAAFKRAGARIVAAETGR